MADDLGNLDIQKQLNDLFAARSEILNKQTGLLRDQLQIVSQIMALLGKDVDKITSSVSGASDSMNKAADAAASATGSVNELNSAASEIPGTFDDIGSSAQSTERVAVKSASMMSTAWQKVKDVTSAIVDVVGSLSRSFLSVGGAILSIPMGMLQKFQEQAAKLAQASLELRKAMEEVRDKFGNIATNEGKNVMDTFKNIRSESGNLAKSGRSLGSIYGYGPEGLATLLGELSATAEAMGPVFSALGDQFEKNAVSIAIMQKGMGITNEAMKELGATALARGQDINDSLREIGNLSVQMGKKFGISSKLMGKDMTYMTSNMGKFGAMTKTQMAASSVYVRKLGLEIKDLEGVMGAFDDFETAATNASKLAQAFGMNVDAMEMMKEQDPAKRLDMLRKSFAATGKSIESMSRSEKAMLAQTAGLSENMVEAALSAKNMGLSYDEVQAAAEGAADKQLTQEEIMQNMANNIKKVFRPIEYVAGLLENFMNGFVAGIMRSRPAMALLQAIMGVIMKMYHLGLDIGVMFMQKFPGVSKMFYGIASIFKGLGKSVGEIKVAFNEFFTDLQKDPVEATKKFMKKIQEIFFSQFDMKKGGGKFLEGLKQFGITIAKMLLGIGKWLLDALITGVQDLVKYLKNPENLTGAATSGLGKMFSSMVDYLWIAIPSLWNAFVDLLGASMPIVWDWLKDVFVKIWASKLGKALIIGVGALLAGGIIKDLVSKIFGAFGSAATSVSDTQGGFLAKMFNSFIDVLLGVLSKISITDMVKFGLIAWGVAEFLVKYLVPLTDAFAQAAQKMKDVNWEDIAKSFLVIAMAIGSMIGIGYAIKQVGGFFMNSTIEALATILITFITMKILGKKEPGLLDSFVAFIKKMKEIDENDILKGVYVLAAMIGSMWALAEVAKKIGPIMGAVMVFFQGPINEFMKGIIDFIDSSLIKFALSVVIASKIASMLTLENIAKLAAVLGLIGLTAALLSGSVIAGVATGFAKKGMEWLGNKLFGGGNKTAENTEKTKTLIEEVADFFTTTQGPLKKVIDAIKSVSTSIDNPEKFKSIIDIVTSTFAILSPLTDLMKMAGEMSKSGVSSAIFGTSGAFSSIMTTMSEFMNSATSTITGIVRSLVDIVKGIQFDASLAEKAKIFGDIVGAVSNLASVMMAPLQAVASMKFDPASAQNASTIFTQFSEFMFGEHGFLSNMIGVIPEMISAINTVFLGMGGKEIASLSKKASALAEIMKAFKELGGVFSEVGASTTTPMMPTNITAFMSDLSSNMGVLSTWMPSIVKSAGEIKGYKLGAMAELVTAITNDIKTINESLESLGDIQMDATIEKVGKALGIKDTVLKLDRKPIQMNVQLNLTMKAEDIAKEIFEVAYKMARPGEGVEPAPLGVKNAFVGANYSE